MKTAIAIRHVHFEDLGLAEAELAARGYDVAYREAGLETLDDDAARQADLVVFLGGPIGAYEDDIYPFLKEEVALARGRLAAKCPTMGICLGAQVMARALSCAVYPSGVKELGWAPLSLTPAGRASVLAPLEGLAVLHWHGDTFDLPQEASLLASTDRVAHQAFSVGDFALALQFHLEAEPFRLERWYIGHAGEIAATPGIDVPGLRRQAAAHAPALVQAGRRVFADWLAKLPA